MFDYKISKHPHFDEACRAFALRHNMAKLAERAGMNVQTLRNKLTRTDCYCSSTSIARWSGAYEFLRKRTCYGRFLFIWDLTRFKKMYKARLIYDDCAFHPGCRYF